jgi:DNA-binding PadR family transcriptional regulator
MTNLFLAEFEFCVMLAIAHLGDDAYGAAVRQEIEARTDRPVSIGALYTTLARLEAKGLLALRTVKEHGQRGRARRYCTLTPAGSRALQQSAITVSRMMRGFKLTPVRSK